MKPSRLAFFTLLAVAALSGCASDKFTPPIAGYTCCNLRLSSGWISSNTVVSGALLPAGEAVSIDSMQRAYYAQGTVGSKRVSLRNDTARDKEETLRWIRRIVVAEDPRLQAASWPQDVQNAVRSARVIKGMTRAQVLMALGYPSLADTPDPEAATWRYGVLMQEDETVDIEFDAEGRVRGLRGTPAGVRAIEFQR